MQHYGLDQETSKALPESCHDDEIEMLQNDLKTILNNQPGK